MTPSDAAYFRIRLRRLGNYAYPFKPSMYAATRGVPGRERYRSRRRRLQNTAPRTKCAWSFSRGRCPPRMLTSRDKCGVHYAWYQLGGDTTNKENWLVATTTASYTFLRVRQKGIAMRGRNARCGSDVAIAISSLLCMGGGVGSYRSVSNLALSGCVGEVIGA